MSIIIRTTAMAARFAVGVALLALAFAATAAPANAELQELEGVIHVHGGEDEETGEPGGSWVRIQEPGNLEGTNNFLVNPGSENTDQTYTLLEAGAGELQLGDYQDNPVGDSGQIVTPSFWGVPPPGFGAPFEIFTFASDPASAKAGTFPAPELEYDTVTGEVTGDLRSWTVNFGGFWFSQGANSDEPGDVHHPDGNLHGQYDPITGHIELRWSSEIVDNYPAGFDEHVGYWRVEGTVEPPE